MVEAGRLGQKSGKGVFSFQNKKGRPEPDPPVDAIIARFVKEKKSCSQEQITARLFLPMLLEATRVLESGVVERVGGERPFTVNVRVLAATNKDLRHAVREGAFREDLMFRLNVLPIRGQPLREPSTQ